VRLGQRPLEIGAVELGREGVQDGLGELIEMALIGQDGVQVLAPPAGRR
jgi:hypothetical protein